MSDLKTVIDLIEDQGEAWVELKTANENRLERLEDNAKAIEDFMAKMTAPGGSGFTMGNKAIKQEKDSFSVKMTDGSIVPVLGKSVNCADFFPKSRDEEFSIGEYAKNVMLGTKVASSSALVPVGVSSQVIDNVRAQTTVIQAGAGTIIIDGPTNLAKITADPTVYEHTESAADISERTSPSQLLI